MTTVKRDDELHAAEDRPRVFDAQNDIDIKEYSEHVESAEDGKRAARDIEYDDQEVPQGDRKGLRRLLRRNPSYNFIREVAAADEDPLDPVQVKKVIAPFASRPPAEST